MIEFLEKMIFTTVYTQVISIKWRDGSDTKATLIFQENGFGQRRVKKEGALDWGQIRNHQYYLEYAVAWREHNLKTYADESPKIEPNSNVIPFKKND